MVPTWPITVMSPVTRARRSVARIGRFDAVGDGGA
jgi:hypothetical protein